MPRAPRRCPGKNGECTNLIRNRRYCDDCDQPWRGPRTASSRVTSSAAWKALQPKVLQRDGYQCQIRYVGVCTGYASVVDKIKPASQRPDLALDPANCRAACAPCNDLKARTVDRGKPEPPRMAG